MINRDFGFDKEGRVILEGVGMSVTDLVFLTGFAIGLAAGRDQPAGGGDPPAEPDPDPNCPLTDDQYELLDPDALDDDDKPEFPTAYDNPEEGSPQ